MGFSELALVLFLVAWAILFYAMVRLLLTIAQYLGRR